MSTHEVAELYHQLAKENKWEEIAQTLYHEKIVSPPYTDLIRKPANKNSAIQEFLTPVENIVEQFHFGYCTTPLIARNMFVIAFGFEVTLKNESRVHFDELGVFTVADGKIIQEKFITQWGGDYTEAIGQ